MRALLPRPGRLRRSAVVVALATLATLACGDSTGPGASTFSATVTGATNRSYSGDALGIADGSGGFALLLESTVNEGPNQIEVFLFRTEPGIPAPGTYDVGELFPETGTDAADFVGLLTLSFGEPDERECETTGGTITITASSSRRVAGSFDMSIECTLTEDVEAEPETATIEGSFDAATATGP